MIPCSQSRSRSASALTLRSASTPVFGLIASLRTAEENRIELGFWHEATETKIGETASRRPRLPYRQPCPKVEESEVEESEVEDKVARCDDRPIPGWGYSRVSIPVKRIGIDRTVVADLRTNFDLRRVPMLPAQRRIDVLRLNAGAVPLHVVVIFGAKGKVVQFVR